MEGSKKFVLSKSESANNDSDINDDSSLSEFSDNERKNFIEQARKELN
jgi:hypothetical protein